MSVPKGKRQEGKLSVLSYARELARHTFTICKNEKCFPKRDRWLLTQDIIRECSGAYIRISRANAVHVRMEGDYLYRRAQQYEAHSMLEGLLTLMDLAYMALDIPSERIEYWTGLVVKTDKALMAWIRSDERRYVKLFPRLAEMAARQDDTEPAPPPADNTINE